MAWKIRTNDSKEKEFLYGDAACPRKDVTMRGLKKLALFWMLALLSVFVPVAHFVLVPAFFLVGIFVFAHQLKFTHFVKEGVWDCPSCDEEMKVSNFYFRNGQRVYCDHCNSQLVIIG